MNSLMAYMGQPNDYSNENKQELDPNLFLLARDNSNSMLKYLMASLGNGQVAPSMPNNNISYPSNSVSDDPLATGSQTAMERAKQSRALDENQRNKALGAGIMKFFSNMGRPGFGDGLEGALSGTAQSILPAFDVYRQEEGNQEALNNQLMQQIQKEEEARLQREQQFGMHQDTLKERQKYHEDESARKREELEWKKLYGDQKLQALRAKGSQLSDKERERLDLDTRRSGALERGETLLATLPDEGKEFSKYVDDEQKKIPKLYKTKETLRKMGEIIAKYPDLGSDFYHILTTNSSERKDGPSLLKLLARKKLDQNKLAAIEQLNKYNSNLNLETIFSVPGGKQATDILKLMIDTSNPNGIMTKKGFDAVSGDISREADNRIKQANYLRAGRDRGVIPKTISEEEYLGKNIPKEDNANDQLKLLEEALAIKG